MQSVTPFQKYASPFPSWASQFWNASVSKRHTPIRPMQLYNPSTLCQDSIMTMISASSAVLLAALLTALWRLSLIGQRPKDYPPGPPTLPILGNLHQITKAKRHLQFEKWARQYGPVYSLMLGTKVMIVLNTDDAIRELVDKRGAAYASRPESYIAQDTISGGLRILWMVCQWLCYLLVLV